jgi:hypothetical protein
MPIKQLQIFGPRGVFTRGDSSGLNADFPYYLNGYFEKVSSSETEMRQISYNMRPGLSERFNANPFSNNYKIRGMVASRNRDLLLVYLNNGATNDLVALNTLGVVTRNGAIVPAAGAWTATGPVVFTVLDGISYGTNVHYALTDFTKGAVLDSAAAYTEITAAVFTGLTKCTNFVGLDGYLFIGTTNNRIYNSDLNVSTSWTSTSFLTAADVPGAIVWLAKIRNFLIAFKEKSIEFFENVGNPTPGSPL